MAVRYLSASLINTAIGVFVMFALYTFTKQPYLTIASSAVIGYMYSLFTYHTIAFKRRTSKPPFIKYAVVYIVAFALNSGMTFVGLRLLPSFLAVQIMVIPLVVVAQWFASSLWAFSSNKYKI